MESTMPWTDITRDDYAREAVRYASDLSDAEWAAIVPLMPDPKPVGRPRKGDLREVVNAILYMASTGCQWRMLPKDFPPFTTVQNYFYAWRDGGLLRTISNSLVMARGREARGYGRAKSAAMPKRILRALISGLTAGVIGYFAAALLSGTVQGNFNIAAALAVDMAKATCRSGN
jgi:transposase